VTPTRWCAALLALVALVAALVPIAPVVVVVAACVVVGLALADALVLRRQAPQATRTRPPVLARGAHVPFEVDVTLDSARSVRVRQPMPPELGVEPAEAAGRTLLATLIARHRGTHVVPPAVVRSSGPLGLVRRDRPVVEPTPVTVFPDLPKARRMAMTRRSARSAEEGRIRARLGLGTEFETVRDYSPDDDVRQINWMATSRVGRPMSNQYRVDENRDLLCMVDAGRLMAAPLAGGTRLDVALDAVAALAVAADDAGDRVGAIAFDSAVRRVLSPRRRGAEAVVRALYDLEPVEQESAYDEAFQIASGRKRALLALFTDVMDESAARPLLEAVPVLVRRHAVLIATCRDPDLAATADAAPGRLFDVYRSAVALEVLESRQRALAVLRALGAVVVDAEPEQFGAACVAGYFRLKQRARL
jgi:uncharacterized protein (DUF58 family)